MQHDLLKRLEEVLLEVEASKLFLDQELIRKLSEGVDGEDRNVKVLVRADMHEVLTQHLPDPGPHEPDSGHVEVSYLNQCLQTELSRVYRVIELFSGDLAEVLDEHNDGILVQVQAALENLVDLRHLNVLDDQFTVSDSVLLTHCLVSSRFFRLFAVLGRCISFEKVTVSHLALA